MNKMPSVNELYETILSRSTLPLPGIEDGLIDPGDYQGFPWKIDLGQHLLIGSGLI